MGSRSFRRQGLGGAPPEDGREDQSPGAGDSVPVGGPWSQTWLEFGE